MVAYLNGSGVSLDGIELAGRAISVSARFDIWVLDVGKRKYSGDPMGLGDIMLKFADP
ncbi:hypothetical protein [Actinomadura sp. NBRC 104425]|uniref:hypothetical protein n=1 Tax=Actinomadura sp. NBRC 104425 TaxID=3032204 RepID=UPI002556B37A|nr:hypothetical protein [Actinomadura sp. NBRC 104425]